MARSPAVSLVDIACQVVSAFGQHSTGNVSAHCSGRRGHQLVRRRVQRHHMADVNLDRRHGHRLWCSSRGTPPAAETRCGLSASNHWRLARTGRRNLPTLWMWDDQYRILRCQHPTMLATWGLVTPTIVLPAGAVDWPTDRVHAVLCHELAHIRRGDWAVALTANVLRAAYWFNPLLWVACRRLRHEGERACDDLVLASGVSGAEYATHLLAVARQSVTHRHPWSPAIAIAHHSMLEGRVRAMLSTRVNREPLTVGACATTVAALVAITVSIGIVTVSGETNQPVRTDVRLTPPGVLPVIPVEEARRPLETRAAVAAPAAQAQPAGGAIEGVLYDQFGGLLPGASVRLTQISSGSTESGVTDRGGAFVFRGLAAGDYELITELPGFITVKNVVRAEQGQSTRRHITLPIGTIEETVHATCASSDRVISPTAPTGSASPGPAQRQAGTVQRGVPPKMPGGTFTGGIGGQIQVPRKLGHVNPTCPSTAVPESTVVRLAGRIGIDGLIDRSPCRQHGRAGDRLCRLGARSRAAMGLYADAPQRRADRSEHQGNGQLQLVELSAAEVTAINGSSRPDTRLSVPSRAPRSGSCHRASGVHARCRVSPDR